MRLFAWVALETAGQLAYPFPAAGAARAEELAQTLFAGKG